MSHVSYTCDPVYQASSAAQHVQANSQIPNGLPLARTVTILTTFLDSLTLLADSDASEDKRDDDEFLLF